MSAYVRVLSQGYSCQDASSAHYVSGQAHRRMQCSHTPPSS
jgi:hypothetical protein